MFSQGSPDDSNVQPGLRTADGRTHPRPDSQMIPMDTRVDKPLNDVILCKVILTGTPSGHMPRVVDGHRALTPFHR